MKAKNILLTLENVTWHSTRHDTLENVEPGEMDIVVGLTSLRETVTNFVDALSIPLDVD